MKASRNHWRKSSDANAVSLSRSRSAGRRAQAPRKAQDTTLAFFSVALLSANESDLTIRRLISFEGALKFGSFVQLPDGWNVERNANHGYKNFSSGDPQGTTVYAHGCFHLQTQMQDTLMNVSPWLSWNFQRTDSLKVRLLDSIFAFRFIGSWPTLHLATLCDCNVCRRLALPPHSGVLDLVHNIHPVDNLAEDDVFIIQEWCGNLKHTFSELGMLSDLIENDIQW